MNTVVVLGATGSLGTSFLNALRRISGLRITGLSCNKNTTKLAKLALEFRVNAVAMSAGSIEGSWMSFQGPRAQEEMLQALEPDIVINAISGIDGLGPAVAALHGHAKLVMGCKEALVAAGPLLMRTAEQSNAQLVPADSEHVAAGLLFQKARAPVQKLILTGTGGALRDMPAQKRAVASVNDVMAHPVWKMGPKITVDSATLVNKALEVIEAAWLFHLKPGQVETRIHRAGTIHAALQTQDGGTLLHTGDTSMESVAWSILTGRPWGTILGDNSRLRDLEPVDPGSCAGLGHLALQKGGDTPALLVGADQAVVEAFLQGRLGFGHIKQVLLQVLKLGPTRELRSIDDVMMSVHTGYEHAHKVLKTGLFSHET